MLELFFAIVAAAITVDIKPWYPRPVRDGGRLRLQPSRTGSAAAPSAPTFLYRL
ncbi:hypothetical protein MOP88_18675 [Sphingomonas sp. WKB10]|nr:hypothetical protein [Sphingomonas sp. WKB10]